MSDSELSEYRKKCIRIGAEQLATRAATVGSFASFLPATGAAMAVNPALGTGIALGEMALFVGSEIWTQAKYKKYDRLILSKEETKELLFHKDTTKSLGKGKIQEEKIENFIIV
jgi:hypothetical protein